MKKVILANSILICLLLCGCSLKDSDATLIGEDKAIEIIMDDHTLSKDSIKNVQVSLEEGLTKDEYVITFDLRGHSYRYGVNAITGEITSISVD